MGDPSQTSRKLTAKQQKFADLYDGNGTETCRLAGYRGSDNVLAQNARENLSHPQIVAAIRARRETEMGPLIANRQRRQEFWTTVMLDRGADLKDRLQASALLGKSEADFVERHEHSGALTLEQLVMQAATPETTEDE